MSGVHGRLAWLEKMIQLRKEKIILNLFLFIALFYFSLNVMMHFMIEKTQQNWQLPILASSKYALDPQKSTWRRHDVPDDGFSGCLLIKDDNHRLEEWLAYHWLVLPLKFLVVTLDPTGTTSPRSILQLWNNSDMGMNIVFWNDVDIGHWIDSESDEKHQHRARQKKFIAACQRYHKERNRTWAAIIDPDEYITYNLIGDNEDSSDEFDLTPLEYNDTVYKDNMLESRKGLNFFMDRNVTIFDYIHKHKNRDPWKSESCHLMPRLFFSAVESSYTNLSQRICENHGFSVTSFNTLRYFNHARKGAFGYNYYGKVIIDLSRIVESEIHDDMESIHRPLEEKCTYPLKPYKLGILRVHHYLGSWEQYSVRVDVRKTKEVYNEKRFVDDGIDLQLQHWLEKFIEKVGVTKAKKLLEKAGVVEKRESRIIDTVDYIKVEPPFDYVHNTYYTDDGNTEETGEEHYYSTSGSESSDTN